MKPLLGHGKDTSGYKGWIPLKFRDGKSVDGTVRYSEGWKNVDNNEEYVPDEGHSGEPPYMTGDNPTLRHRRMDGNPELWASFRKKAIEDAAREGKQPPLWTRVEGE